MDIRADPPLGTWPASLGFGPIDERSERFREELGLPTDAPIVMTGHQPILWHSGILSKYLAVEALAETSGARAAWLVVDQDVVDPYAIDVPARDAEHRLISRTLRLAREPGEGLAASSVKPQRALTVEESLDLALPDLRERLPVIRDALAAEAGEPTMARQVVRANFELLRDVLPERPIVYASDLNRTSLFAELLGAMRREPEKAVSSYNQAASEFPEAGIAPLRSDDVQDIHELPLWSVAPSEPRRRVFHHELDGIDPTTLAPRALLVTAMMRLAGCELFVHGTGGAAYDRVTERWMKHWLGATLAPKAAITADLRLKIEVEHVTASDVARATWLAHSARHNPGRLGDPAAQNVKDELVRAIEEMRERGDDPADLYQKLHENRRTFAFAHAKELAELDRDARALARKAGDSTVASRRDWPSVLYANDQLVELRDAIRRAMTRGVDRASAKKRLSRPRAR